MPEHLEKDFTNIWQEFEEGKTLDARFAKALDRVIPVLQNINNNGQSWVENNVTLEQVISKSSNIAEISPVLWDYIKEKLENATFW